VNRKFFLVTICLITTSCSEVIFSSNKEGLTLEQIHDGYSFKIDEATQTFSNSASLDEKTILVLKKSKIISHIFSDGKQVLIQNQNGFFKSGSDIILGETENLPEIIAHYEKNILESKVKTQGHGRVPNKCIGNPLTCATNPKLWPGRMAYVFDADARTAMLDSYVGSRWLSAIASWNKISPVQLHARKYKEPYILFKGKEQPSSVVGNYNTIINTNDHSGQPMGVRGCYIESCFHHELAHAVGLKHEHQRCDRDRFLNFSFDTNDSRIAQNYERICDEDYKSYGLYAFDSLMHYGLGTTGNSYGIDMRMEAKNQLPASEYRGYPSQAGKAERLTESDRQSILAMYGLSDVPNVVTFNKTYVQVKQIGDTAWQDWKENNIMAGLQGGSGVEAIRMHVRSPYEPSLGENLEDTLYIEYAVNVPRIGWTEYARNGGIAGTTSNNAPVKGLQVVLRGTHEIKYRCSLSFRVSAKSGGWQPWVENGAIGSVSGSGNYIDGVQLNVFCLGRA
jgi:hypothetical protein